MNEKVRFYYCEEYPEYLWIYTDNKRYFIEGGVVLTATDKEDSKRHIKTNYAAAKQYFEDYHVNPDFFLIKIMSASSGVDEQVL